MSIYCEYCGHTFKGKEDICPKCGKPRMSYNDGYQGTYDVKPEIIDRSGNTFVLYALVFALLSIFGVGAGWYGFVYPCVSIGFAIVSKVKKTTKKYCLLVSLCISLVVIVLCSINLLKLG